MIKLKFDVSQKLRYKKSLFIKGNISTTILEVIHSLQTKYYHAAQKMWECKPDYFPILLDKLKNENITIHGDIPKKYQHFMELLDIYEKQDNKYSSKTKPFDHQIASFRYALTHNKFLLGDEQGLGKTKQALDIAVSRKHKMHHCLIICGVNGLKYNWLNEVTTHTNEKGHILGSRVNRKGNIVVGGVAERYDDLCQVHDEYFLITNLETLRDKRIQGQIKTMCESGVIGMTIIDEIHKAKNPSSAQGKAIHCCCSYYRLALTGTPLMNNAVDLYNILKWLQVDNGSFTSFKNRYCIMGGFGGYQIVGYKNLDELETKLQNNMLRRRKQDVLNLPPKIYTNEVLELSNSQQKLYDEVKKGVMENIDKILLMPNPLVELTRLRQVTSNPDILTSSKTVNCKYERILDILDSTEDKLIIYSNWSKVIDPLYELIRTKYRVAKVTGETKNPMEQIEKFQNDSCCRVIVGTTPALGTGYTLTQANTIIFIDEPWNMATKEQAEDRAHRIGTKGTVNIITLMCRDTIDERIHSLIVEKGELSDRIVDGRSIDKNDLYKLLT